MTLHPSLKTILCWIGFLPVSLLIISFLPWVVQKFAELSYMWVSGSTDGWACVYAAPILGNFMGGFIGLKSAGAIVPKFKKTIVWILFILFLLFCGFGIFQYYIRSDYFLAIQSTGMAVGFVLAFFQIERNDDKFPLTGDVIFTSENPDETFTGFTFGNFFCFLGLIQLMKV